MLVRPLSACSLFIFILVYPICPSPSSVPHLPISMLLPPCTFSTTDSLARHANFRLRLLLMHTVPHSSFHPLLLSSSPLHPPTQPDPLPSPPTLPLCISLTSNSQSAFPFFLSHQYCYLFCIFVLGRLGSHHLSLGSLNSCTCTVCNPHCSLLIHSINRSFAFSIIIDDPLLVHSVCLSASLVLLFSFVFL